MDRNATPTTFTRDFGVRRVLSLTLAMRIAGTAALAAPACAAESAGADPERNVR